MDDFGVKVDDVMECLYDNDNKLVNDINTNVRNIIVDNSRVLRNYFSPWIDKIDIKKPQKILGIVNLLSFYRLN